MTRRRLIPGISRHSFIEAVRARQWPLLSARGGGAESEERSFALMFEAAPRTYVSWIELTEIPRMPFVEVDGDEPDLQLSQEIATVCQSLDDATLLALPEHAPTDEARSLAYFAIAVGAPENRDPELEAALATGLSSPEPEVRHGVLLGLRYLEWRCCVQMLGRLASLEPDTENRRLASAALRRFS